MLAVHRQEIHRTDTRTGGTASTVSGGPQTTHQGFGAYEKTGAKQVLAAGDW